MFTTETRGLSKTSGEDSYLGAKMEDTDLLVHERLTTEMSSGLEQEAAEKQNDDVEEEEDEKKEAENEEEETSFMLPTPEITVSLDNEREKDTEHGGEDEEDDRVFFDEGEREDREDSGKRVRRVLKPMISFHLGETEDLEMRRLINPRSAFLSDWY